MLDLWHGDCLVEMDGLPDGSVDMVLCDLPYGTTRSPWDCCVDLDALWKHYRRLCPRGAIVLFAQAPFDKVLGVSNLSELRYEWIWEKTLATGHLNAKRAPMKAHENILVFCCSGQAPYFPQMTTGHERKVAVKRGDRTVVYGDQTAAPLAYDSTERYPRSVITGPRDTQRSAVHSTQKPVWLCEYLIRSHSLPGQLVLDNCMGSGSTGIAARQCGRRFIGIEKDREIFETASLRLQSAPML